MDLPERRAELPLAYEAGKKAYREGKDRAANPHLYRDPLLAKEWDQGWKDAAL